MPEAPQGAFDTCAPERRVSQALLLATAKKRLLRYLLFLTLLTALQCTKKGELQSKIDRKNEEINILKIGLSGIAKRYGYQNVQEFYRIYHKSHSAYVDYKEQVVRWKKRYGEDSERRDKKVYLNG